MSHEPNEINAELAALIGAYLDDAMTGPERAAFERRAATDAELTRELELQRRIDARLGVLLAAPEMPELPAAGAAMPIARHRRGIPAWARLAAALALATLGAWGALTQPWKGWLGPEPSDVAANVSYRELVKDGLRPIWVCENDAVFRRYTGEKLGTPFTIAPGPGVEVVGWTYALGLLDSSASVLMCRVDGRPSIVVVGKKNQDRAMHADAASGVHVHRHEAWGLVMYEINEREDAPILARLRVE